MVNIPKLPEITVPDKLKEINLEFVEKHMKRVMNDLMELMDKHDAIVPEIKVKYKNIEGFLSFKRLPTEHNEITDETEKK